MMPRLTILCAGLFFTACSKLTENNLQKVHNGMTTTEVKAILGAPSDWGTAEYGSVSNKIVVSDTTHVDYVYHTDKSDVKITFVDDKVIATEGQFQ
jgi:hypothetical protein